MKIEQVLVLLGLLNKNIPIFHLKISRKSAIVEVEIVGKRELSIKKQ